ncbi:MAG TPA: amino acid adenylation domain-containing protein, partial [Pyrinomonadaceae bacterium]|nr:amino acid adenylation domain-containing protein [Pyrinomonadaceae bacterium]
LLSHYSGDDDVLFGVTVAGRPAALPGVESMVGLFINTLPLRAATPARTSVLSWLKDLQEQQVTMQQYEYSSLVDIQGWSEVPRAVPLFESIFVFENLPAGGSYESENRGVEIRADRGLGSTTGYPLTVLVSPGAQMTVQIVFDRARFEPEAIRRMLGHFQTLLQNLTDHSAASICSLPLLTDAEREQIVHQWNDTEVAYGVDSVLSLFEAQAARTPDGTAVEFESQQLNYRELNARANQLAHHLRGLGLGGDDRVGICIDRSLEMAVAVLGVLKAGAAYVPLDPAYPSERLTFMLEDAQCKVVLTSEPVAETLSQANTRLLRVNKDWGRVAGESAENPQTQIAGGSLAYVIYTSGSTGWPKGVALEHCALANLISWQLDQSFTPARTLQFASLSFDVSFQEIFSTWCSGGTLLLVSDELRRDAPSLLRFFDQQKVQRIFLPFVYLQHLAEAFSDNDAKLELREIITAGEQLEITPQIANLCNSLKELKLHNQYGPSESHVVTAYTLSGKPQDWPRLPPIGRPISNTQIYVLDQSGQPAPIGVAGELCIGGANLARGYLNRPELTAEKFISNPFSDDPAPRTSTPGELPAWGTRVYRTGDLARFAADGNIEFLGRFDNQIKIRGFRIELGEIEATLAAHPSVREAVVVVHDEGGDRRLLGYVVPSSPGSDELAVDLRRFLKTKLPDYMAPSDFVFLEALPLTPSGKINRRALPGYDRSADEQRQSHVPPRTDVERQLAEIWSAVLKRASVGIDDNFFELGGHSLLATQLISRVRSVFKIELPLRYLFEFPTVAGLAVGILEFAKEAATAIPTTITREARDAEDLLARIDELTDEQVEALLSETLG